MRKKVEDIYLLDDFLSSKKDKSEDFKVLALKLMDKLDSISEVSKFTGVPEQTLYDWLNEWTKKNRRSEQ